MATDARQRDDILLARLAADKVWENLSVGTWKVAGKKVVKLPIGDIGETREHRAPERERPYRNGAKFDTTGWRARRFEIELIFENSMDEPATQGRTDGLYPNGLFELLDSFEVGDTGDLYIPTRGQKYRAKALNYSVTEKSDERDGARVKATWVEDNEESIDASSFERRSIRAGAKRLADEAKFDAESDGLWMGSLASLNEFVSEIEGIANQPNNTTQHLISNLRIIRNNARRLEAVFSDATIEGRDLLLDPMNSKSLRNLRAIAGMAQRGEAEIVKAKPPTVDFVAQTDTTLVQIAAKVGQSFDDLLELNQYRIMDPADITAGTVLRVFEARP